MQNPHLLNHCSKATLLMVCKFCSLILKSSWTAQMIQTFVRTALDLFASSMTHMIWGQKDLTAKFTFGQKLQHITKWGKTYFLHTIHKKIKLLIHVPQITRNLDITINNSYRNSSVYVEKCIFSSEVYLIPQRNQSKNSVAWFNKESKELNFPQPVWQERRNDLRVMEKLGEYSYCNLL